MYLFTGFFNKLTTDSYKAVGIIYRVDDLADLPNSEALALLNYTSTSSNLEITGTSIALPTLSFNTLPVHVETEFISKQSFMISKEFNSSNIYRRFTKSDAQVLLNTNTNLFPISA
jgi:hypothetical protein